MADNTSETSIKQVIQGLTGKEVSVYQGTVTSVSPLKIQIVNDEKLVITEANTILPKHLTDYTVTADINGGSADKSVSGATVTIYNALEKGDSVHILSLNHGKQYYVLDKV